MTRSPQAVLFMCGQNSVRSPIAASLLRQLVPRGLYIQSAGVSKAEIARRLDIGRTSVRRILSANAK